MEPFFLRSSLMAETVLFTNWWNTEICLQVKSILTFANYFFLVGPESLWKLDLKFVNIYQIFHKNSSSKIYEINILIASINSSPLKFKHNLQAASLNCSWFFFKFACAVGCGQLVPKYVSKVLVASSSTPHPCQQVSGQSFKLA